MQNNAGMNISYGSNSKRIKVDIENPITLRIIFPTSLAENFGVSQRFFNEPIGRQRHAITYSVDLKHKCPQSFCLHTHSLLYILGDVTKPILSVIPYEARKRKLLIYLKN